VSNEEKDERQTNSGIPVKVVYDEADLIDFNPAHELGRPGAYPFTRGIHPDMYRGRLWTMRQYAGFGTAEETNRRFLFLLAQGQTGLSVAFDLPTQLGLDSDHPLSHGEVGKVGVAIDTLEDMERLFQDIPLEKVSVSMTINATAAIILAMYLALAKKRGIPWNSLAGTIQNDILKEYIARGTYIFPPRPSLRLIVDTIAFCQQHVPRWNTMSISGYHIREAGATAVQELAFTLANAITYIRWAIEAGLDPDKFTPRLSFFLAAHNNFFEEIAKFRAARRIWAKITREKFGLKNSKAWKFRFHTQTSGSTLTAQEPENNVIRVTLQALAAVLGGTQSLHTNSRDEALSLPSAESARLALRTQQIIAYETGVTDTVDPLGGSYFLEKLTNQIEEKVWAELKKIDDLGGMIKAIEEGYIQRQIQESAYTYQKKIEKKKQFIIGLNVFAQKEEKINFELYYPPDELEKEQIKRLTSYRLQRSPANLQPALDSIKQAAQESKNIFPFLIQAVEQGATLGEITSSLKEVFGTYQENIS
jgi:methylmalonyl-CoA mutase N-terminal domain/subunit